ncbi:MAG: hypothetical protein KGL18_08220 [Burkholderiales bacterium]|nr:hypothetical protein [Burkholderiales bacterium]MDE1929741.1 hypothetical protein [Burkholderiales bacterium]MDE2502944.1 hypothetical protein [Burkholderiales bacterium]
MNHKIYARRFACACTLGAAALAQAGPIYSDGTMALAQFSSTPTWALPGTMTVAGASAAGNPGPGLQVLAQGLTGQTGYSYIAGFVYSAFSYDPTSAGAISSIDFSIDRAAKFTDNGTPLAGVTITGRVLIEQGGQLYMAISPGVAPSAGYTSIAMPDLVASDFGLWNLGSGNVDATLNPDFSAGAMQFGFAMRGTALGYPQGDTLQLDSYADNFWLRVNNDVPSPGTLALALAALALLAAQRQRARR